MNKKLNTLNEAAHYKKLIDYCAKIVDLNNEELTLIHDYFDLHFISKNDFLLETGNVCRFIAFISDGAVRHFHIKDGDEKTCDITFENNFVTDFQSFTYETPAIISLKSLENTTVLMITKIKLVELYKISAKFETIGRITAERVAQRATDIAMSLSSDKPEERYTRLIKNNKELLQRVPQKYIANFLGISPESLSRIRKRITHQKS